MANGMGEHEFGAPIGYDPLSPSTWGQGAPWGEPTSRYTPPAPAKEKETVPWWKRFWRRLEHGSTGAGQIKTKPWWQEETPLKLSRYLSGGRFYGGGGPYGGFAIPPAGVTEQDWWTGFYSYYYGLSPEEARVKAIRRMGDPLYTGYGTPWWRGETYPRRRGESPQESWERHMAEKFVEPFWTPPEPSTAFPPQYASYPESAMQRAQRLAQDMIRRALQEQGAIEEEEEEPDWITYGRRFAPRTRWLLY